MPGVRRGAAADPVPGGAGHLPQDPQPGAPGPRHQDPQRLGVHQEPVQPDVRGERPAAAVAGGPAGAEQAERRGAAAGEGEAAAGAGCAVSREDTEGGGGQSVFMVNMVKGPSVLLVLASLLFSQRPGTSTLTFLVS